jgi:hypothetical protein
VIFTDKVIYIYIYIYMFSSYIVAAFCGTSIHNTLFHKNISLEDPLSDHNKNGDKTQHSC